MMMMMMMDAKELFYDQVLFFCRSFLEFVHCVSIIRFFFVPLKSQYFAKKH